MLYLLISKTESLKNVEALKWQTKVLVTIIQIIKAGEFEK